MRNSPFHYETDFNPEYNQALFPEANYPLLPEAEYHFRTVSGGMYSIIIKDVTDTEVTLQNTRPGCGTITVSHAVAYDMLDGACGVQLSLLSNLNINSGDEDS